MTDTFYLVFDTETSGLYDYKQPHYHQSQPHVVQLAAVLVDQHFEEVATMNCIIKPNGWEVPPSVTVSHGYESIEAAVAAGQRLAACDIHGISQEMAIEVGISLESALSVFNGMAELADISICHNADFDVSMLMAEHHRAGIMSNLPNRNLCTMKSTTDLLELPGKYGSFKWPKLQELHKYLFGCNFEDDHDALADVQATKRCYEELVKRGFNDWHYSRIVFGS